MEYKPFCGGILTATVMPLKVFAAIKIAAAGGHNILFVGKDREQIADYVNCLARFERHSETVVVSPDDSLTKVIGGCNGLGGFSKGLVTEANNGILFLNGVNDFNQSTVQLIRNVVVNKRVTLTSADESISLPADFQMAISFSPTSAMVEWNRLNLLYSHAPIVCRLDGDCGTETMELNEKVSEEIDDCRRRQKRRGFLNSHIDGVDILNMTTEATNTLLRAAEFRGWYPRRYLEVAKVARTIADFEGKLNVTVFDVLTALSVSEETPLDDRPTGRPL